MEIVGSTRGVVDYWIAPAVWEVATGIDDGLVLYGRDINWDHDEEIDAMKVRSVGSAGHRTWARYEPTHRERLEQLTEILGEIMLLAPYETDDEEAVRILNEVNSTPFMKGVHEAYTVRGVLGTTRGRRHLGAHLSQFNFDLPWCGLLQLVGRDGPDAFLTKDPQVRDAVFEALRDRTDRVRW